MANEPGIGNKRASIDMHFLNLLHPKLLKNAMFDFVDVGERRPNSSRPINRCAKMQIMHIYPTTRVRKLNHMHASLDRNLPKLVR